VRTFPCEPFPGSIQPKTRQKHAKKRLCGLFFSLCFRGRPAAPSLTLTPQSDIVAMGLHADAVAGRGKGSGCQLTTGVVEAVGIEHLAIRPHWRILERFRGHSYDNVTNARALVPLRRQGLQSPGPRGAQHEAASG